MRSPRLALRLLALALLGSPCLAQYNPLDAVVAVASPTPCSLLGITPQGVVYTVTARLPHYPATVIPAPDNRCLLVSGSGPTPGSYLTVTVTPGGTVTSLFAEQLVGMDVDGGGNLVGICSHTFHTMSIVKVNSRGITTLYTRPHPGATLGAIDLASGDFIFCDQDHAYRLSLHDFTQFSTLLALAPARLSPRGGLHPDPTTGDMLAFWNASAPPPVTPSIVRLHTGSTPAQTVVRSGWFSGHVGGGDRVPGSGQFVIPAMAIQGSNAVYRFDPQSGAIVTLTAIPGALDPRSVAIAGSRHLWAPNDARPGRPYRLVVSSPAEPGAAYAIGVSFGFLPGIPVGGRRIHLNPDSLFLLSMQNRGIFSGFRGTLDARGEGVGTIAIPDLWCLSGLRFFAVAITHASGRIRVISEPLGITIQ
jgi:hypothetical protein